MTTAQIEYEKLLATFRTIEGVSSSQMFGKPCLKIGGKAFISQHNEAIAFKLSGAQHAKALAFVGATLWDPSGKGRPMKEWVALSACDAKAFNSFASSALAYVSSNESNNWLVCDQQTLANVSDVKVEAMVEVVPYDETWPAKFEAERMLLEAALAPWLAGAIEHIGSTSVARMPAKPVIDIMAPVHTLEASRQAIEAATNAGYVYFPYKAEVMHWFCKPSPHLRTHHLHLVPFQSALWQERLHFRDALRREPVLAAEYAELKLRLAQQFRFDREAYTEAKGPFVHRVLLQSGAVHENAAMR